MWISLFLLLNTGHSGAWESYRCRGMDGGYDRCIVLPLFSAEGKGGGDESDQDGQNAEKDEYGKKGKHTRKKYVGFHISINYCKKWGIDRN